MNVLLLNVLIASMTNSFSKITQVGSMHGMIMCCSLAAVLSGRWWAQQFT